MTRRERVKTALDHGEPDFCPYNVQLLDAAFERVKGRYSPDTFDDAVGNHIALVEPAEYSIFRTEELPGRRFRDAFGATWALAPGEDIGSVETPPLREASLKGWAPPKAEGLMDMAALRRQTEQAGDRFVVGALGFSLFERAWILRGLEQTFEDMAARPAFLHGLLDAILQFNLDVIDRMCALPLDMFHFGDDWGRQQGLVMGPRHWRAFFKPRLAAMCERVRAHGLRASVHSCGDITEILPDLVEVGVSLVSPLQGEVFNFADLKRRYGKELSFWGGISTQKTLPFGTPAEIRAEAERAVSTLGQGGGYILAPSHEIQGDVPAENIFALIDFALEMGGK